jgi:hypothetical protein
VKERKTIRNRRKAGVDKKKLRGGHDPSVLGKATQFQPGVSGNPAGRPATKPIVEAIREVIRNHPDALPMMAKHAVARALYDVRWFREVRDMLDGKPTQQVEVANAKDERFKVDVVEGTSAYDKLMAFFCAPAEAVGAPMAEGKRSLAEGCREAVRTGTPISDREAALLRSLGLKHAPTDATGQDP